MRDGTITLNGNAVMHSHTEGELWGIDFRVGKGPVSSGDDNKIMFWDLEKKKCERVIKMTDRKENTRRGEAERLPGVFDSQQCRTVAVNEMWLAMASNDGAVVIRKMKQPNGKDVKVCRESIEWIESMGFSADGEIFATASHDE